MWQEDDEAEAVSEVTEQEVHQGALQRQFFGRAKLMSGAVEIVEQVQAKGGMMVVEGGPGEGKTVFMVNFLKEFSFILFFHLEFDYKFGQNKRNTR